MRRERTCLSISRVRYRDRFNSQIREQSWPFLMSVASIMSTDARLDFTFVRTTRSIERRVSPVDSTLCPCSPAIIAIAGICCAEDDQYICKNIECPSRAIFCLYTGVSYLRMVFLVGTTRRYWQYSQGVAAWRSLLPGNHRCRNLATESVKNGALHNCS
jgi:hypothetical protein